MKLEPINLARKLGTFSENWSPRVIAARHAISSARILRVSGSSRIRPRGRWGP